MLAEMKYLNTQHSLPVHAERMAAGKIETRIVQPRGSIDREDAKADVHSTLIKVQIDQYPSRYCYGARKVGDLTKEYRDKAFSDIKQTTSHHAQLAQQAVESNGKMKASARAVAQYTQQVQQFINETRHLEIRPITDPTISWDKSRVEGDITPRRDDYTIDTHKGNAPAEFKRGNYEGYLKDEGFIRRWVSVGEYDIRI